MQLPRRVNKEEKIESKRAGQVCFIDFQNEFDTSVHEILLHKLEEDCS